MREIKFRAWGKEKAYMLPYNGLHKFLAADEAIVSINYKPRGGGWEPDAPYHFTNPQTAGMVVMQYTGLKDKNGKEIYEGDILRVDWRDKRYPPTTLGQLSATLTKLLSSRVKVVALVKTQKRIWKLSATFIKTQNY
jgi:uncharacterized phage protein (TIGR01671 family)